jgi:predicted acetyltransferase
MAQRAKRRSNPKVTPRASRPAKPVKRATPPRPVRPPKPAKPPRPAKPIGRPADEKEMHALAGIAAGAFAAPPERMREWLAGLGPEVVRVYRRRGEVIGGLVLHPAGQWFGGRCVPMTGVALVCVAPQHRADGIASKLMREALLELRAGGIALSTLYAATVPLYRRAGYEAAGGRYEITLPANAIGLRDRELPVREAGPDDWPALDDAYRRRVAHENGPLDQQAPGWRRALRAGLSPQHPMPHTYAVWNGRRVEGYVRYPAKRDDRTLHLIDLVATTPRAGRRLLTFLADHRTSIESAVWCGAPNDPALLLLPEHAYRVRLASPWMLRVVDVPRALEARGYPAGVEAAVDLYIDDDLLPANRGPFVLEVSGGRGVVRSRGRGAARRGGASARIDVRGLAALYSAHLSADQLAMTPYLEAAPAGVDALRAIFAGSTPWMTDAF